MTPNAPALDPPGELIRFIDAAPTPYHAVWQVADRLRASGFARLNESDDWSLSPGDCAYTVRGGGSLIAWRVGGAPVEQSGFILLGAHTDSPNLRVKPRPDSTVEGWHQLDVEVYGGVMFHSWLDRDLGLAGRIVLSNGRSVLVRLDTPLLRIPSMAVHLQRLAPKEGLVIDPQKHLLPILGPIADNGGLRELLREELVARDVDTEGTSIHAWDLCLYDTQRGALGGPKRELVLSARLDNLSSCYTALQALAEAEPRAATQVIALVDHEEVGSESAIGAKSRFLLSVLERIVAATGPAEPQRTARALAHSLLVSADMAHAVHPGFLEKYEPQHLVMLGQGPVVKISASQSYATDATSHGFFLRACEAAGVPVQQFVSRNDVRCGSTLGPLSAARLGVRTVDVGCPMLAMHSCREVSGAADVGYMVRALTEVLARAPLPSPED